MIILNQKIKDQRKLENVQLLSLIPSGADFYQVWERYRLELVGLERRGLEVLDPATGANRAHKVILGMIKGDSPQRSDYFNHVSHNAELFCPRCDALKSELWVLETHLLEHHRKGLRDP